jgi:hypothetical protein
MYLRNFGIQDRFKMLKPRGVLLSILLEMQNRILALKCICSPFCLRLTLVQHPPPPPPAVKWYKMQLLRHWIINKFNM